MVHLGYMSQNSKLKQKVLDILIIEILNDFKFDEIHFLELLKLNISCISRKVNILVVEDYEVDLYGMDAYIEFSRVFNIIEKDPTEPILPNWATSELVKIRDTRNGNVISIIEFHVFVPPTPPSPQRAEMI